MTHTGSITLRRLAVLATCLFALRPCIAGGGLFDAVHPRAVSWWRFDPSAFASANNQREQSVLFKSTARAAIASGLFGDGTPAKVIEGILAASDVGGVEHTLSLFDFHATRPPSGTGVDIRRLQMVLELHTAHDHERYLRTIKAIVVDAEKAKAGAESPAEGEQRVIDLPDGSQAVTFRFPSWPAWREISWCSRDDSFVIAIGRDALASRFGPANEADEPSWPAHLNAVESERRDGQRFFSAFLDIRALRRAFPAAFMEGRTPRMVRALGLTDTSELMLHGRLCDRADGRSPMLALDATTRGANDETVRHVTVSLDNLSSEDVPYAIEGGSYLLAIPVNWIAFAERLVDIYSATIRDDKLASFERARASWRTLHGERFSRVLGRLEPWLILADKPTPFLPIPGLSTYVMPIRESADVEKQRRDMAILLGPWRDVVSRTPNEVWSLAIHPSGLVRFPTWSIVTGAERSAIVGGWGPGVVEYVQKDLNRGATPTGTSRSSGPSPRP